MSKFTFKYEYDGDCETELTLITNTEQLSDVVDSIKEFLAGCGFQKGSIDDYFD